MDNRIRREIKCCVILSPEQVPRIPTSMDHQFLGLWPFAHCNILAAFCMYALLLSTTSKIGRHKQNRNAPMSWRCWCRSQKPGIVGIVKMPCNWDWSNSSLPLTRQFREALIVWICHNVMASCWMEQVYKHISKLHQGGGNRWPPSIFKDTFHS